MARYNEILIGRLNRGLQKFLGMKGESPAPQLSSEIMPVLPLPLGIEYFAIDGWGLFAGSINVGAVAAQNGQVQLRNPVGSGVIAVVEAFLINPTSGGATFNVGPNNTDSANIIPTPARFDPRSGPAPTCVFSSGASAGVFPAATRQILQVPFSQKIVIGPGGFPERPLLPGDLIFCQDTVVNEIFIASIWWRERPIEESEKS